MKGKRDARRAQRERLHRYLNEPADEAKCECGHGSLPACWHRHNCPAWFDVRGVA